jgi:hypothetical protein
MSDALPAGAYAYPVVPALGILVLGVFRLRLAFWILLVVNAISIPIQIWPPIEPWRFAIAALDAIAVLIAVRGLADTKSRRVS